MFVAELDDLAQGFQSSVPDLVCLLQRQLGLGLVLTLLVFGQLEVLHLLSEAVKHFLVLGPAFVVLSLLHMHRLAEALAEVGLVASWVLI